MNSALQSIYARIGEHWLSYLQNAFAQEEFLKSSQRGAFLKLLDEVEESEEPEKLSSNFKHLFHKKLKEELEHWRAQLGTLDHIVFLNGVYQPDHSSFRGLIELSGGVIPYEPKKVPSDDALVETAFKKRLGFGSLSLLNIPYVFDGSCLIIDIPSYFRSEIPFLVLNFIGEGATFRPLFFRLKSRSNFTFFERTCTLREEGQDGKDAPWILSNESLLALVEEKAYLRHISLGTGIDARAMSASRYDVSVHKNGEYQYQFLNAKGAYRRREHAIELLGEHAKTSIRGAAMFGGDGCLERYARIDHRAPSTLTRIDTRSVLWDSAKGDYHVEVDVLPEIKGCEVFQSERVLYEDEASVKVAPFLKIENDEVKATHAVAVGRLDDETTSYLESRGFPKSEAFDLLSRALLSGVFEGLTYQHLYDAELEALLAR